MTGCTYGTASLVREEFLDRDLGESSKSESDRYRKDSRRCGRFWRTRPAEGLAPSRGLRVAEAPFSTSKLQTNKIIHKKGFLLLYPKIYQRANHFSHW